jgi:hypothetical protein
MDHRICILIRSRSRALDPKETFRPLRALLLGPLGDPLATHYTQNHPLQQPNLHMSTRTLPGTSTSILRATRTTVFLWNRSSNIFPNMSARFGFRRRWIASHTWHQAPRTSPLPSTLYCPQASPICCLKAPLLVSIPFPA